MNHNVNALAKDIQKAAKTVAFQWPGIVEADDLTQDISVKLLESPSSVEKLLTDFDDRQRLNAIIKIGHQIAAKERTDYEVFSGNFRYSVNEVKRLLDDRALQNDDPSLRSNWTISDNFTKGGEFADAVNTKSSSETDLRRGMDRLTATNERYAEIIQRRYLTGESVSGNDSSTLSRALTQLTTNMNRSFKQRHAERPDGPGTRKAISNSHAQLLSSRQYGGDNPLPSPGAGPNYKDHRPFSHHKGERL